MCKFKDHDHHPTFEGRGISPWWSGQRRKLSAVGLQLINAIEGITIYLDVEKDKKAIQSFASPALLLYFGFFSSHETLSGKTSVVAKPGAKILHIFNELYNLPNKYVLDYIRLKIAELFLLIYTGDFKYEENKDRYYPRTLVQSAKNARKYIDEHFYEHFTIADLARQCTVNSKKLMECFKYIYGMTINDCISTGANGQGWRTAAANRF